MSDKPAMIEMYRMARLRGVPIVSISTPDQTATVAALQEIETAKSKMVPLLIWDLVTGMRPLNGAGEAALMRLVGVDPEKFGTQADPTFQAKAEELRRNRGRGLTAEDITQIREECVVEFQAKARQASLEPDAALVLARRLPGCTEGALGAVVFLLNAQAILAESFPTHAAVRQAVCNLRDVFESNNRMLVLLGPDVSLPPELATDVIPLREDYPDAVQLRKLVVDQFNGAELPTPDAETLDRAVDALRGIAAFPARQIVAMSLSKAGLNLGMLWERKRTEVEKTRGLSIDREAITVASVGGKKQLLAKFDQRFKGPARPKFVLRIDEIDKALAGAGSAGAGDSTGTAQDQHGVLLSEMEDNRYRGMLLVSPPGCGKTLVSKALGGTYSVMSGSLDLGAMLSKWVGSSQEYIRAAFRLLRAIAGPGGVFVIGTCNKLESLSPEMRRRFTAGIWYDDLPTRDERRQEIWPIQLKAFGLPLDSPLPDDTGWTGADIRNCCDAAWTYQCSLVEAAESIVPVSRSDPGSIDRLREMAKGAFLSTAYPGPYRGPDTDGERSPSVEEWLASGKKSSEEVTGGKGRRISVKE